MDRVDLGGWFLHLLILWFVAIGGPATILPDVQRYVVEVHHLVTNKEFAELYTLALVAPGPNAMYVTLIGWHVAGLPGVAATTLPPERALSQCSARPRNPPRPRADHDRTDVRERDNPDARGQPRLARVLDDASHRHRGPAQAMEPTVVARRRRAGRHIRPRLSRPGGSKRVF